MKFAAVLLAVAVAAVAATTPVHLDNYVEYYSRNGFPSTYEPVPVPKDEEWFARPVQFTIALKQKNLDKLEDFFWKVSDPRHELYGKYMTREEIHTLTEADEEVREDIMDWVKNTYKTVGVFSDEFEIIDRRSAIKVVAPVATIEALFKTTLAPFKRTKGVYNGHLWVKYVDSLSIPREFEEQIKLITGIVEFAPIPQGVRLNKSRARGTFECNVPYTMKRMYNIDDSKHVATQNASQAPYSELGNRDEGFGESDLAKFQSINDIKSNEITNIIGNDAARYTPSDTDTEACLDVQCLTGFGVDANTSFWVMNDWMYEFAQEILNTNDPPLVNSMSYGWYESQQCRIDGMCGVHETSEEYVQNTDVEFQKLGAMGITMLAASGDDGVESDRSCDEMRPDYPASSVYVTSCGATAVVNDHSDTDVLGNDAPPVCSDEQYNCKCSTSNLEHAAMRSNNAGFDSGGGFSMWLPQPAYQKDAVEAYLNSGVTLPSKQYWNSTNRGYPDVAAVGASVLIIKDGKGIKVGGTSASTPIWGGIISLLNSDRLVNGQPPLGFINPLLYQMWAEDPATFNDITVGTNGGGCSNLAFDAAVGWDPLTGLGSPNYAEILEYIQSKL